MHYTLAAICHLILTATALAWGYNGHRVVAEIAAQHMTPEAAKQVQAILGDETMADASTWADEIKNQRPETRPWHYLNPPNGTKRVTMGESPEEGSVLSCLVEQARILRDPDATAVQRAEALRFVIHMVGDIHQPMHVSRASDRGGNSVKVTLRDKKTNLHAAWDSGIINLRKRTWQQVADTLNAEIVPEQVKAWSNLDPEGWATESYTLAMTYAYKVPADGKLDDAYIERSQNIIDERLQMAGVRLAALLNAALAD